MYNQVTGFLFFASIVGGLVFSLMQDEPSVTLPANQVQSADSMQLDLTTASRNEIDAPVEIARRELRLLDDMYKTSIVLITEHYVNSDEDLPAGEAFKLQFAAMQKTGWHEVKLLDATGDPLNPRNKPRKGFEARGVAELLKGTSIHEEVVTEGDRRFLLATTAIPVVMEKCIMCHDNYAGLPEGQAIGAISFKVPILDEITPILPLLKSNPYDGKETDR